MPALCVATNNTKGSPDLLMPLVNFKQWDGKKEKVRPEPILGLRPANERRRYKVTPSLIGRAHT